MPPKKQKKSKAQKLKELKPTKPIVELSPEDQEFQKDMEQLKTLRQANRVLAIQISGTRSVINLKEDYTKQFNFLIARKQNFIERFLISDVANTHIGQTLHPFSRPAYEEGIIELLEFSRLSEMRGRRHLTGLPLEVLPFFMSAYEPSFRPGII